MNLKNISLKKLDNLPAKQSFSHYVDGKFNLRKDTNYNYYTRHDRLYSIIRKMVAKFVDKPHDELVHCFKKYYTPHRSSLREYTSLPKIITTSLYDAQVSTRGVLEIPYRREEYYIDKDGIIRVREKEKKASRLNHFYNTKKNEYKKQKLADRRKSLMMLKMINNRDLFDYYVKLYTTKSNLLSKIRENKHKLEYNQYNKITYKPDYWRGWYVRQIESAKKELPTVIEAIELLEKENYSAFYNSKTYLYSLYKECHHFTTP